MAPDDRPPNVVLLTAHDMGRYLGCYGRQAHTPNLDELAADGALFEQFFCTTPHCAPSRASIQTGLLPHNHGMMGHPIRDTDTASPRREPYKGWEIDEGVRTLPMYLNERGYDTHLAVYQHASGIPERVGYGSIHEPRDPDGRENGARNVADCVERVLDEAVGDDPFYLEAGTGNTHSPYSRRDGGFKDDPVPGYEPPAPDELDLPDPVPDTADHRRDFAALLEDACELDHAIGCIRDALTERGLAEDTLVAFVTDHGIDLAPKGKGTCYDPGIESALLMSLPGRIEAGARHDALASNVDVLPTVLDLLGFDVPYGLDGRSLRPLLEGRREEYDPREAVFAETTWFGDYVPVRAVRTARYKYLRNCWPRRLPDVEGHDWDTQVELYDLGVDPEETENVAGDPAYADVQAALHARLARKLRANGDPILEGPVPPKPGVFDVTLRTPATPDGRRVGDGLDEEG